MASKSGGQRKATRQQGYLEAHIARTDKLKIPDLLEIYSIYDALVIDYVFQHLLLPYTRFARDWLVDQARDVYAGTDRNRLIMTARSRKAREATFDAMPSQDRNARWGTGVKSKYLEMITQTVSVVDSLPYGETISSEELRGLGFTRLVCDDAGLFVSSLAARYPEHMAEWCSAYSVGDLEAAQVVEEQMRGLEAEIGIRRQEAWYVFVNTIATFDQIEELITYVCNSYTRLLFRFAHGLRGVTSVEENFSTGYEGLVRAARNYDPADGSAFVAHSQWWIRSAILQRQRQTSVISLPTTTWYQLNQISRGEGGFTAEKVGQIKERAEMFYAHSQNGLAYDIGEEDADGDYSSMLIPHPDAHIVLGDGLTRAQDMEAMELAPDHALSSSLEEIAEICAQVAPGALMAVVAWGLREGIDAFLLASAFMEVHTTSEDVATTRLHAERLYLHKLNQDASPYTDSNP